MESTLTQNDKDLLFRNGLARRAAERTRRDKAIEVFPGVWSTDPQYLHFIDLLSIRLTKAFPPCVDDNGMLHGNGVRSNFLNLRYIGGFPMKQATWPLIDNSHRRSNEGLLNEFKDELDEKIFRAFVRVFFEEVDGEPVRLRKGSSSMIPFFTTDPKLKEAIFRKSLQEAKTASDYFSKGEFRKAFAKTGIGGAYFLVYRTQTSDGISIVDGNFVPKTRMVADREYALSSGRAGRLFASDRDASDVPNARKGFFRPRLRTAMGAPLGISSTILPIAQGVRRAIYRRFPFSFHHTTREKKQERLRQWHDAIFVDVSDHDMLWPHELYLDVIIEELLHLGYSEWWVKLLDVSLRMPIYVSTPAEGEGHELLGSLDEYDVRVGLPSGHPMTDLLGSLGMAFIYALIQLDHTARSYKDQMINLSVDEICSFFVRPYLRGELPFGAQSKSDDAVMTWKRGYTTSVTALRQKMKDKEHISPYMHVSYEIGAAFLGDVAVTPENGRLDQTTYIGNIVSYVVNLFAPEYSLDSHIRDRSITKRGFPGLGYKTHPEVYGSSPIWVEINRIIDDTWFEVFSESFDMMRRRQYHHDLKALNAQIDQKVTREGAFDTYSSVVQFSPIDYEVLVSPDKLRYKYQPSDVHPLLLGLSDFLIAGDEIREYITSVYKGATYDTKTSH